MMNIQVDWPTSAAIITALIAIYGLIIKVVQRSEKKKLSTQSSSPSSSDDLRKEFDLFSKDLEKLKNELLVHDKNGMQADFELKRTIDDIDKLQSEIEIIKSKFETINNIQIKLEKIETENKAFSDNIRTLQTKIDKINYLLISWLRNKK